METTKVFDFYGGIVSGFYFFTRTSGIEYWYNTFQTTGNRTVKINRNGQNFFNSFYMGFVFGFHPIVKPGAFLQPKFELSFLPDYANIYNSGQSLNEQKLTKNMVMLSVIAGLGHKKKLPKTE